MSEDLLSVELLGHRKLLRDVEAIPDDIRMILKAKFEEWVYRLRDLVEDNIADRLQRVTGKLEESVQAEITNEGLVIEGRVYIAGVPYARIQEEGGTTPAHMIYPKNGKVLAFMAATGDKVFATRVFHPGGVIAPKRFMRDAYREISPKVTDGLYYYLVRKLKTRLKGSVDGNG